MPRPGLVEDLLARAWGYLVIARRAQYNLRVGEEVFERAFAHLRQGTGEPLERAFLLDLKASLGTGEGPGALAPGDEARGPFVHLPLMCMSQ